MARGLRTPNALKNTIRSLTVVGILGIAACSDGSKAGISEAVSTTEAPTTSPQAPPTTSTPTVALEAPSVTETSSTISQATSTTKALGGLVALGTVTCPDGMPVVGVWVETAQPDRGWADWQADANNPAVANYSRNLDQSVGYGLNLGCGGTTKNWALNIQVDGLVAGTPATLTCGQAPDGSAYSCLPNNS